MDVQRTVECISHCSELLLKLPPAKDLPLGGIAHFIARQRCGFDTPSRSFGPNFVRTKVAFAKLSGRKECEYILDDVEGVRADLDQRRPTSEQAYEHIAWMADQLPAIESAQKAARWLGFIEGVHGYDFVTFGDEAWKNGWIFLKMNDPAYARIYAQECMQRIHANFLAPDLKAERTDLLWMHFTLGFLQGFLWAAGGSTINELRQMNAPDQEA